MSSPSPSCQCTNLARQGLSAASNFICAVFPRFAESGTIARCPDWIQGHRLSNAAQRLSLVPNGCLICPVISNDRDIFTDQKDDCCVAYPPPTSAQRQTALGTMVEKPAWPSPPLPSWDPIKLLGVECPPRRGLNCIATNISRLLFLFSHQGLTHLSQVEEESWAQDRDKRAHTTGCYNSGNENHCLIPPQAQANRLHCSTHILPC